MYNHEYLSRLQADRGFTIQQIAEGTGISETTVWRIMKGVGKSPYYENVRDICLFLGGSLDEMEGLPPRIVNPSAAPGAPLDPAPIDYRHYIEMVLTHKQRIRSMRIWLGVSFFLNVLQAAFIMGLFAYDITHPNVGWIQYSQLQDLGAFIDRIHSVASVGVKS